MGTHDLFCGLQLIFQVIKSTKERLKFGSNSHKNLDIFSKFVQTVQAISLGYICEIIGITLLPFWQLLGKKFTTRVFLILFCSSQKRLIQVAAKKE